MGNGVDQGFLFTAEEMEAYRKLKKLLRTPTEIMEVFKALIFAKNNVQPLMDGSTNKLVSLVAYFSSFYLYYYYRFFFFGVFDILKFS